MAQKNRSVRRIDEKSANLITGGGQLIQSGQQAINLPSFPTAPPPENVIVSSGQALLRTTYTPKVLVAVSWEAPLNLVPELYSIESAENANFTTNLLRSSTTLTSGVIELKPDTDYWIRVQALVRGIFSEYGYPANYPVASVHTISDTTPPGVVTGVTTNWNTGDLRFSWTNPSSSNFFQTRIRIYDTFGGTLYVEDYIVGNPGSVSNYVFTVAMNNRVTGNNPLTTVYYELLAYSIAGVPATSSATGTVTKAKPSIPTGLANTWTNDDGTYDEGVTISWNSVSGASSYRLIIDGVTKNTPRTLYTYNYTENVSDHRPTLVSGDFSLAYTIQSIDPLNQISGGASGTATNLAPSSSNLNLSYVPGFSSLYAYVTPTTEIKDLYGYRWTLKSGGVNVSTVLSFTPEITFASLNGVYTLELYAIDLFGRKSTTISGVNIILDGLTIEELRADIEYTQAGATFFNQARLKDSLTTDDAAVFPLGSSWKWIKGKRALLDRYRTISLHNYSASGTSRGYFGLSSDDDTYRWFAGPLGGTFGVTLVEHATETIAQASGILIYSHPNIARYDLPEIIEARFIKVGFRDTSANFSIAEYYPRRLIQSDDIEAETIKGINIAAATITADKISVISLAAITIYTGALTVSGVISIHTSGGIYQGTGTFASPTTGLKIFNSGGVGKISGYNATVEQVTLDTDGKFKAAGGLIVLDSSGIHLRSASSYNSDASIQFRNSSNVKTAEIWAMVDPVTLDMSTIDVSAATNGISGVVEARATISATSAAATTGWVCIAASTLANSRIVTSSRVDIEDGLNVGSAATGAANGELVLSNGSIGLITAGAADIPIQLAGSVAQVIVEDSGTSNNTTTFQVLRRNDGTGTVAAGFGNSVTWSLDTNGGSDRTGAQFFVTLQTAADASRKFRAQHNVHDTAAREYLRGEASGSAAMIGFLGTAASAKLAVTGSRGGNAALASLLTQLATYGLITDSSSA